MRPQILKQVLTVSGVMAAHDPCTTWTRSHAPAALAYPSWGLRFPTRCRWCTCPGQPLHLLIEHAIQRLEERSQPTWNEDDDGVRPPLEVGNEIFVSVALEVVLLTYDSITVSSTWKLTSVSMRYSQGDGVNASLSRLAYYPR